MDAGLDRWHGLDVDEWRRQWEVPVLRIYDRVGSTNDVARTLAETGAAAGATVLADEQTRGRGRRGRVWRADADSSLLLSMVFRCDPDAPLSIRLGLATARAIDALLPTRTGLKWPNDLQIGGRKVGGILCEATGEVGGGGVVIAGLGLNVRQRDEDWPPELAGAATSLEASAGPVDLARLAGEVVGRWLPIARAPGGPLSAEERTEYAERDVLVGRDVTVGDRTAGVAAGIDPSGALRLETSGTVRSIQAGTVRPANPDRRDTP